MAVTNNVVTLAEKTNTLLLTGISILLPIGVMGLNMPLIDIRERLKHIILYLERFISEDESIYPIFRGLFEAKSRTDV